MSKWRPCVPWALRLAARLVDTAGHPPHSTPLRTPEAATLPVTAEVDGGMGRLTGEDRETATAV